MKIKALLSRVSTLSVLTCIAWLGTAATSQAQDCEPRLAIDPCSIDLQAGVVSLMCGATPHYEILAHDTTPAWDQAVIKVSLTEGCSRACVLLDYGKAPAGWTFNLGDSSTNNGFGGGSPQSQQSEAEFQILDDTMTLFSRALAPGVAPALMNQKLALEEGGFKVCVSDQTITHGQPQGWTSTPVAKLLYALPDTNFDGNSDIFIGLNRVVFGPGNRTGSGLQRAYITID